MKKYNFLVLTDHRTHSNQNSIYALLSNLSIHEQCQEVWVASRGHAQNSSFFNYFQGHKLYATRVHADFAFQTNGSQFTNNSYAIDIEHFDVIFLRLPRPISDSFFHYLLEIAPDKIFINHPHGILETSSKEFLLNFKELCPPMKLCRSAVDVLLFAAQFPIVLKPLKGYGGDGIVKIENQVVYQGNKAYDLKDYLLELKSQLEQYGMLAMKYLSNVSQGDKRILVVNGQVLASSLRMPPKGSWLCNVAQGGSSYKATITDEEKTIVEQIMPILTKKGIVFCGIDTLVDDNGNRVLSEINTLSIGGFPQSEQQTQKPITKMAIDNMFQYIATKAQSV